MNLIRSWNQVARDAATEGAGAAGTANAAPVPPATPPAADPAQPPAPTYDFSFMPENYRSGESPDLAGFATHYGDSMAELARLQEGQREVPEAYEWNTPENLDLSEFALPEGFALTPDAESPLYEELGGFLKEYGVDQAGASTVMGLVAKMKAGEYQAATARLQKDLSTLADTPDKVEARIKDLGRRLDTRLPADQAAALKALTTSSAAVRAIEALMVTGSNTAPTTPQPTPTNEEILFGKKGA